MTDFPGGLHVGTGWFTQFEHHEVDGRRQPQLVLGFNPPQFTGTGAPAWLPFTPADARALADALHVDADRWQAALDRAGTVS